MSDVETRSSFPSLEERQRKAKLRLRQLMAQRDLGMIDTESGAPLHVRALVGSASTPQDALAGLRKFYPDADFAPSYEESIVTPGKKVPELDTANFVFRNPDTKKLTLYRPQGYGAKAIAGDVASVPREIAQGVGATVGAVGGAIIGSTAGPVGTGAGSVVGAGVGTAGGGSIVDIGRRAVGMPDTRTSGDVASQYMTEATMGAAGQAVGMGVGIGVREGVKRLVRGGEQGRAGVAERVRQFGTAGAAPTLAQATNRRALDTLESFVSRVPGGSGPFRKAAIETQAKIGKYVESKATAARAPEPAVAGRVIEEGSESFLARNRARWLEMDTKIKAKVPAGLKVPLTNTQAMLKGVASPTPELPSTGQVLTPSGVRSLASALETDLGKLTGGGVSYDTLQEIRSRVGARLASPTLVTDLPSADLKRVYAALTADMRTALAQADAANTTAGNPTNLVKAFDQSNKFYKATIDRAENTLQKLIGKRAPEQIFAALESSGNQGGTVVRQVMRSLTDEEKQIVSATVLRRLGHARAAQQGAEGETFSLETFLTRWNTMSKDAKDALFNGPAFTGLRGNLDDIAEAAEAARESSRAFANPSGTGGQLVGQAMMMGGGGGILVGILTGNPAAWGLAGVIAAAAGSANAAGRLMTNPNFVRWLAKSSKVAPNGAAAHLARLSTIAAIANPEDREAIEAYLATFAGLREQKKPVPQLGGQRGPRKAAPAASVPQFGAEQFQ